VAIGLVHPGEMGAALGGVLAGAGHEVVWASAGRSDATKRRAAAFVEAGTVAELAARCDTILSVCPPHAALDVAREVAEFDGVYVDANAVSPATARAVGEAVPRASFVDGGIVGGPDDVRLYLSGDAASQVAALFDGTRVATFVLSDRIGDASAMKMIYAAWTKGSAALLLAVRGVARASGLEDELVAAWDETIPGLTARSEGAARSAAAKGWRWEFEMEEIAATFADAGFPDGFHRAAADMFRREAER
jgi:3-hydroxyisobutyrate dehydrogenase-like beta-hydroxyacid dehydrogenase